MSGDGAQPGSPLPGIDPLTGVCSADNVGPVSEIISWVLVGVSFVFLALRLYCKWIKSKTFWWDDWLLAITWIFLLISGIVLNFNVKIGFGRHMCDLVFKNPTNISPIGRNSNIAGTFTILGTVWSKTSFALTLLRIAEAKWLKIIIWTIIATINVTMTLTAILAFLQCNPTEKVWGGDQVPGTCWREAYANFGIFTGVYSGVMDIILAMLPWAVIWGLQMKLAEKIGVAVAMSAGIFAGTTAFVKSAQIPALAKGDFTYDGFGLVVWSTCEVAMTIIAACIPVLRVLVRDVKKSTRRHYGSSGASGSHSHSKSRGYETHTSGVGGGGTKIAIIGGGGCGGNNNTGRRPSGGFSRPFAGKGAGPGGGGRAKASAGEVHHDDWSERSIFHADDNRIIHTQEIKVEYHPRGPRDMASGDSSSSENVVDVRGGPSRPGSGEEYEMGRMA
ncbi:hypothetical protein RB595_010705 [Gaeumannomyces hyphopodioides]